MLSTKATFPSISNNSEQLKVTGQAKIFKANEKKNGSKERNTTIKVDFSAKEL